MYILRAGVDKGALIEVELAALEGIRWDVYYIARQAGLIDLADTVELV